MKKAFLLGILLLLPGSLIAEIPVWQPEVLVKANYGDLEFEYGYDNITETGDTSPVSDFYIGSDAIYLFDLFQNNVKIYDLDGEFIRTITTKWPISNRKLKISASDLLVHEDLLYVLDESGSNPPEGESIVKVYIFDLETERPLKLLRIHNPEIGRSEGSKAYSVNSTRLRLGQDKRIWIYDRTKDKSFLIAQHGRPVNKNEHTKGVRGDVRGSKLLIYNKETKTKELYDSEGKLIRAVKSMESDTWEAAKNYLGSIYSSNCEYFLVPSDDNGEKGIFTLNGQQIGRVLIDPKTSWATYSPFSSFQFDSHGRLYRIYAENDGIYLYRWSVQK